MKRRYLHGTLISDAAEGLGTRGAPYVKFTLRDEDNEDSEGKPYLVNCLCFIAGLWPEILGCRKGDALSVVGRFKQQSWTGKDHSRGHGVDLTVRCVLSVYKLAAKSSRHAGSRPLGLATESLRAGDDPQGLAEVEEDILF